MGEENNVPTQAWIILEEEWIEEYPNPTIESKERGEKEYPK